MCILRIPITIASIGLVVLTSGGDKNIFCSAIFRPTSISGGASVRTRERRTRQEPHVQGFHFFDRHKGAVELHGNPVVTQDIPPPKLDKRGVYCPHGKTAIPTVIRAAISAMVGFGVTLII
mmetsp:Transcript_13142/g.30949  ORF Transcript_13142/g.30949 Transcript_13142/m.30949 type:complete len:121 (-) Transcript_13142:2188-2550(-)